MKKLVAETLNEYLVPSEKEVFKGEKKTGLTIKDVDSKEFLVGLAVEKLHSSDIAVQKALVFQHLSNNPKFYSEGMKKGIFDEVEAINLYKKYFIDKEEPEETEQLEEKPEENLGLEF